jgi:hypothetical protein
MPRSRNRYARAQARARYRKPKRRGGSFGWTVGIIAIVVAFTVALFLTVMNRRSEAVAAPRAGDPTTGAPGDHWHASLDVNVCGQWLSPAPNFESQAGSPDIRVGIHSHGDGLVHIHPFNSSESGKNATLGRFLNYGGWSASSDSLDLWAGTDGKPVKEKNGDACTMPDGTKKKGALHWYVNGKEQTGDPAGYRPKDHDRIALVFAPAGTKLADLGTPPNSKQGPSDESPYTTVPGNPIPGSSPPESSGAPPPS